MRDRRSRGRWGSPFFLPILCGVLLAAASVVARDGELAAGRGPGGGATPETVVVLHGLARGSMQMLVLEWRLTARGYHVCNIGYETRVDSIGDASDAVHGEILVCAGEARRIDFVTHSLGGLVLRSLLVRHEIPTAGRAVMLAPPNQGSEIADAFEDNGWLADVFGPLTGQLGTEPHDLPRTLPPPRIPFAVIAGDRWINPVGPFLIAGPHDGTVSVASTRLEGMADHLVLPYTHTFIMNPEEVAEQIDRFLRHGRFDHPNATGTGRAAP